MAIQITRKNIFVIKGDPFISKWVDESGRLDHDRTIDTLCEHIPVGGVVIDAGAAIGDHTTAYAGRVGPKGMVLAFEPNPEAYACLVMNTVQQPWVYPFRCGLGSDPGMVDMDYRPDNIWASNVSAGRPNGVGSVPVRRLDDVAMEMGLKRLDFLKMDVEGFEPQVLAGAWHVLEKYRPIIASEINQGALAKFGWTHRDVIDWLKEEFDYRMEFIDPKHTIDLPQFDVLFFPK